MKRYTLVLGMLVIGLSSTPSFADDDAIHVVPQPSSPVTQNQTTKVPQLKWWQVMGEKIFGPKAPPPGPLKIYQQPRRESKPAQVVTPEMKELAATQAREESRKRQAEAVKLQAEARAASDLKLKNTKKFGVFGDKLFIKSGLGKPATILSIHDLVPGIESRSALGFGDGRLFVDLYHHKLGVIDLENLGSEVKSGADGRVVKQLEKVGSRIIAFEYPVVGDNYYTIEEGAGIVVRQKGDDMLIRTFGPRQGQYYRNGIKLGPDGRLYFTSPQGLMIYDFASDTMKLRALDTVGPIIVKDNYIVVAGKNAVYLVDVFKPNSQPIKITAQNDVHITPMDIDSADGLDKIIVAGNDEVGEIDLIEKEYRTVVKTEHMAFGIKLLGNEVLVLDGNEQLASRFELQGEESPQYSPEIASGICEILGTLSRK